MVAPSAQEQYLLELINDARLDPLGNAARYIASYDPLSIEDSAIRNAFRAFGVDANALLAQYEALNPAAPLAWNEALGDAAEYHNAAMIRADQQAHQLPNEPGFGQRLTDAGYPYRSAGENIYAFADSLLYGHAGFMVDWGYDDEDVVDGRVDSDYDEIGDGIQDPAGHRQNIMSGGFTEVGIAVTRETDSRTDVGEYVITQDFGNRGYTFVTGVAYSDLDDDGFYSVGEGRGDLVVSIGSSSVTTYASGGYSLQSGTGAKAIVLSGAGLSSQVTVNTTISENLKLDVVDGNTLLTSGSIAVDGFEGAIKALGIEGLTLSAGAGSQTFEGTSGSDRFDGGAGTDVAIFSGAHGLYTVTMTGTTLTVSSSADGTDTLEDIETLRFADGDYHWSAASAALVAGAGSEADDGSNPDDGGAPGSDDGSDTGDDGSDPGNGGSDAGDDGSDTGGDGSGTGGDGSDTGGDDAGSGDVFLPGTVPGSPAVYADEPGFSLIGEDGYTAMIGGTGKIFGTPDHQDITLFDVAGEITFDPSFNRGGDVIRFTRDASHYAVKLVGSSVVISDGDSEVAIPIGPVANILGFADGTRELVYDVDAGVVLIGTQAVTSSLLVIDTPAQTVTFEGTIDPQAEGTLTLAAGAEVATSGDVSVFGTKAGAEDISHSHGDLEFDPSFNQGGDTLHLLEGPEAFSAYLDGSTVVLFSDSVEASIPIGPVGMDIDFGGITLELRIDTDTGSAMIGDRTISGTSEVTATALDGTGAGDGGVPVSGDIALESYGANTVSTLELDPDAALDITYDANGSTDVVLVNFDADDRIIVDNADASKFSYGSYAEGSDGVSNDLRITFNNGSNFAQIVLEDVVQPSDAIYSEQTAEAAAGWNFITFA
ncbi:hypothetical protein B2G71_18335 [Novosphingobium sp. PC22D]|uniref:CAP domain-containing protein n=1 Tax=Novosphingobium sp. PC22D TaxID=1962403 RepID=UPI000BF212BA|nr:CAP domain-containing protein [Novosphingobium sp. PC22D]PEQ11243.1 hypothetical protein B2G71_18335 [Novosphingobium sp. PC22D]